MAALADDDITNLISPTEPPALRAIGTVSSVVEKKGCDILIVLPELRVGIQRKTWIDLVISLDDGRLANSIPKMDMAVRIIILEGKPLFGKDGRMVVRSNSRSARRGWVSLRHTRESLAGVCFSLRYNSGIDVIRTENLSDTIMVVQRLGKYLAKSKHRGISGDRSHSSAIRSPWGGGLDAAQRKWAAQVNFLQALGIGRQTAENLLTYCGGKVPLQWKIGKEELLGVPLIGHSTADKLLGFFD